MYIYIYQINVKKCAHTLTLFHEIKYVNQTLIHIASPLKDTQ